MDTLYYDKAIEIARTDKYVYCRHESLGGGYVINTSEGIRYIDENGMAVNQDALDSQLFALGYEAETAIQLEYRLSKLSSTDEFILNHYNLFLAPNYFISSGDLPLSSIFIEKYSGELYLTQSSNYLSLLLFDGSIISGVTNLRGQKTIFTGTGYWTPAEALYPAFLLTQDIREVFGSDLLYNYTPILLTSGAVSFIAEKTLSKQVRITYSPQNMALFLSYCLAVLNFSSKEKFQLAAISPTAFILYSSMVIDHPAAIETTTGDLHKYNLRFSKTDSCYYFMQNIFLELELTHLFNLIEFI